MTAHQEPVEGHPIMPPRSGPEVETTPGTGAGPTSTFDRLRAALTGRAEHPRLSRWIHLIVALQFVVMTVYSAGYGYQRDELYFRMLPPAWGYVDQPPFTPFLVRTLSHLSDHTWSIRLAATLATCLATYVHVLITREFGGSRRAQVLSAAAYAFALVPLSLGHNLLTATVDLPLWGLTALFIARATLRGDTRWWIAAGVVIGLTTYNRWLIIAFVLVLLAGIVLTGPRNQLTDRNTWIGGGVALVLALPNLWWQAQHGWPQLTFGMALAGSNNADVRRGMWSLLPIIMGPFLLPVWAAGIVALFRRPAWRRARFFVPALIIFLLMMVPVAGQAYYPVGLVSVLLAIGCVPVAEWATTMQRRRAVAGLLAANALTSVVFDLPVLPIEKSPTRYVNPLALDASFWPTYVRQVADAYEAYSPKNPGTTVVLAGDYGEAGAIDRFGPAMGLPSVYSGHNTLGWLAPPPNTATAVVAVGIPLTTLSDHFLSCTQVGRLDNGYAIKMYQQGQPIVVCDGRRDPWPTIWSDLAHWG
ncbi:glycosyltransferase family 39 protein [Raineyella sp.]|uniref:Glycosyltransferase RgtA/B/C/D-like domain-containing protein n=1 Tax=bioreactor metagenome TaxID=1076179 RepID=A0A644ZVG0_9ZZZZ|nr:glycosyltransferase family 39 protein [Raineyella sp.]MEA5154653.1 glycosyltransferase family 39 protein [Raineyella sp.]